MRLDDDDGIGAAARRRVQEPLVGERITYAEAITIRTSGIDEKWALVVTVGKTPPYGYTSAGRILIAISPVLDSDPLAGLLWIEEYGRKMITHVWVDPEVQGQGVGRALVDAYRNHVSRSVTMAGPFSAAGFEFAKRFGAEIVEERAQRQGTTTRGVVLYAQSRLSARIVDARRGRGGEVWFDLEVGDYDVSALRVPDGRISIFEVRRQGATRQTSRRSQVYQRVADAAREEISKW